MGTAMVICFAIGALLIAAGTPMRHLALIGGTLLVRWRLILAIAEPYRRERLISFIDPFADAGDTRLPGGAGADRDRLGGFFGVGLGESVQKIFYLPEAHTDMILAVIGEELGLFGILGRGRPLRDDRLRRAARRQAGARPLLEAARRRASPR